MVKRSLSLLMAFVLVFAMAPVAFAGDSGQSAEEGAGNMENENAGQASETGATGNQNLNVPNQNPDATDESGEDEGNRDPKDDVQTADKPEMTVNTSVGYSIFNDEHYYYVEVYAYVPSEESITGKFEMFLDGKKPVELDWEETVSGGYAASAPFILKKAGKHKLLVRFKGEVDGEKVTLESKKTVKFPSENFRFEVNQDGKGTFGGKLSGVKKVKGRWTIRVFDPQVEEGLLEEHESDITTSLEYSHTFKGLKPGTYDVRVSYSGIMDGMKAGADGLLEGVKIGGDGSGDKEPPVKEDPDKKGEVIEKPTGGKLPETSTPYPSFALLGLLVLLAGVALLKFRTARE